jgi:hypothetical protein
VPDTYEQSLRVLGLEPGATEPEIKAAYRDLVKVWHPDRFGSDARLRAKAQEKLKEVNAAFEHLSGSPASGFRRTRESPPPKDAASGLNASHPSAPASAGADRRGTKNLRMILLCGAVTGIVGASLFIWRSRQPQPAFPPDRLIQAPTTAVPARALVARQPGPPSRVIREAPESAAVSMTGSLVVASRPLGARVSFDGRVVGETPIRLTEITPGEHRVELALTGDEYRPWASSVVVAAGSEEKLLAVLTQADVKR